MCETGTVFDTQLTNYDNNENQKNLRLSIF